MCRGGIAEEPRARGHRRVVGVGGEDVDLLLESEEVLVCLVLAGHDRFEQGGHEIACVGAVEVAVLGHGLDES